MSEQAVAPVVKGGAERARRQGMAVALSSTLLVLALAGPVHADTTPIVGSQSGWRSTASQTCVFNAQTNTYTFTLTNTSPAGSTITAVGFDLPPAGNASTSGLNGFTGSDSVPLDADFAFSDAVLGEVPHFAGAVLDFGFVTGTDGTFADGDADDGLLPGASGTFTVSGAAFAGFTEEQICNAIFVRFMEVPAGDGTDVGAPGTLDAQPDARIKRSGGQVRGNDVYNTTGEDQTVALTPPGGSVRRVYLTIQNDGEAPDRFDLTTTGDTPAGYELRYFVGRSDVELTAAIESDTFQTPTLEPGEKFRIRVRIETTTAAAEGSMLTRLFTFTSELDSSQDAARLTVSRR